MAAKRLPMRHLRELLRLKYEAGLPHRVVEYAIGTRRLLPYAVAIVVAAVPRLGCPSSCAPSPRACGYLGSRPRPSGRRWSGSATP